MEQTSGEPKKTGKRGVPIWLAIVLGVVILLLILTICLILLLRSYSIRCVPIGTPSSEATPAIDAPTQEPEPAVIETQTAEPTEPPTEIPTEEPTPEPTAQPTPVPDYFMFGGKKIKTGETKINGKNLGINGKKNKLKHIPEEEVHDLVTLCPDLEELTLDYCYMDDYAPLGGLSNLRELQLPNCGTNGGNPIKDVD